MNPRAAINDLLPFQGSPFGQLGYFSITARNLKSEYYYTTRFANCLVLIFTFFNFLSSHTRRTTRAPRLAGIFSLHRSAHKKGFCKCKILRNGEGGIRTHAPLRTNGFQDRLVMTTSIPLHLSNCLAAF